MPYSQITIRLPGVRRTNLTQELRRLPGYLSGKIPDRHGYGRAFKGHFAHYIFTKIRESFLAKSDGGKDVFGDSWKPLKRETIAQRPVGRGQWKKLGLLGLGRGGRGLLTTSQNRLWKGIFASTLARLAPRIGEQQAKVEAAKLAWAILKSRGAKTRLESLGGRHVPILRVSDRLLDSLSPGEINDDGSYQPPPEQVLRFHRGAITVGTEVPYAKYQHKTRRLWPTGRKMAGWGKEGVDRAVEALVKRMEQVRRA